MAIPYRTAIFKSANIFVMVIWGTTTKLNYRQYFQLYGIQCATLIVFGNTWGWDFYIGTQNGKL